MGKKSAPKYATTTYSTDGLFGSATSSKKGTSFTGEDWQNTMGNTGANLINTSLANMLSNDYANDPNFQAYQNQLNKTMAQNYDTSVLAPLTSRGLMRSSGLQAATNSFANTLADQTTKLFDSYYDRQANTLANALNAQNQLFSWITGINNNAMTNSQNVSAHAMEGYKADQALKGQMWQALGNALAGAGQGAAAGATAAAAASDINVKENIVPIGEKDGYNWYEFTYKKGLGLPEGKQIGVIAQEVEKINPDAVFEINGIKHVDYSKIQGENNG